jgi:hypothetical protein
MSIYKKIIEVQRDVGVIAKNADVKTRSGGTMYKGVLHDDVTEALRVAMIEHGIVAEVTVIKSDEQSVGNKWRCVVDVQVTYVDADDPDGKKVISIMPAAAEDVNDKNFGKAISMATKYAHLKTFMLRTGENEEERVYDTQPRRHNQTERVPSLADKTERVPTIQPARHISPQQATDIAKKLSALEMKPEEFFDGINRHLGTSYDDIYQIEQKHYGIIFHSLKKKHDAFLEGI